MTNYKKSENWPESGLEYLNHCPLCQSPTRTILHDDLQDKVFFCAPGIWKMWRCDNCHSGYLDPRPNKKTIGLAYSKYYTHDTDLQKNSQEHINNGLITKIKKRFRPAYLNVVYGHSIKPDLGWLNFIVGLMPSYIKRPWDFRIRHIPAASEGSRLLDIGCGNGRFLKIASELGYHVTGLEIDPLAIDAAQSSGFSVLSGLLPETGLESNQFDQITLNHVLEHLHSPKEGIAEIYRLLKPGGRVWMQLPNIEAYGHEIYGSAWRGLEPPRHLVMPTIEIVIQILKNTGFEKIMTLKQEDAVRGYFSQSDKIKRYFSESINSCDVQSEKVIKKAILFERKHPKYHEQMTIIAFKP
jgi:2-polyprenyl-3-methyl-5-hydroxy-6-metoxy-1,4-benzoquinol methylase